MIKFYAKENQMVKIPGAQARPGQPDMYVGRDFDAANRGYKINDTGYTVDENSDAGQRLIRLTRIDDCLIPADKYTADLCGKEYVPVEFKSGVFVEKSNKSPKQSSTES